MAVAARLTLPLALAGTAVSAYLTVEHYAGGTTLACPETGVVNCAKVTSSAQSMVGPLPVALLGLLFFAILSVLCLPAAWRRGGRRTALVRLGLVGSGLAAALYLIGVELIALHAICLWCTTVHLLMFVLFVLVLAASLRLLDGESAW